MATEQTISTQLEKHTSENALPSPVTDNQDKTPINLIKEPEMMVNPLLDGFPVIADSKGLFSGGLTGAELAKRLGVDGGTISRAWKLKGKPPRPPYFAKWSREKDPNGLAWEKRGDRYYPRIEKD